jgi:hypothetical protein
MLCRGERDVNAAKRRVDRMTASDLQIKTLPPSEREGETEIERKRDSE